MSVGVRCISLSSALCIVNTVRCKLFRNDWIILYERKNSELLSTGETICTGVPFALVCAQSVVHPAASSSRPTYRCCIEGATSKKNIQRILYQN